LNKKAITYIKMVVINEIFVDIRAWLLPIKCGINWRPLTRTIPVNHVHLIRELINM
jgi:hypothetical protein